jgi:casein kinase II subunit alpha
MKGRAIQREMPQYAIETVSRVYPDACSSRGPEWSDSENWTFPTVLPDDYVIADWIGTGKYSDVFIGYRGATKVALKVLKPVRAQKYNREVKILMNLADGPNIVKLFEIVQNPHNGQYTLVFEYIENVDYARLYPRFTDFDAKLYLFELMKALRFCHSRGIMHRDVKPQNIMYEPQTRKLRLIYWGLAEFYQPRARYNIHVASRHFKAIELLVDYQCYDYSVDIWGFGVTMAGIIFNRTPFFRGNDDFDMVAKIATVLGRADLDAYLKKYAIDIPEAMAKDLPKRKARMDFASLRQKGDKDRGLITPAAVDLLNRCLRYDHMERISADEALQHEYFRDMRVLLGDGSTGDSTPC